MALLQGKVVLDVGCGSGILSMFAARAGAHIVIGVDASDIIGPARAVVQLNRLSDTVQLYHSTVEEFVLPSPLDKVSAREAGLSPMGPVPALRGRARPRPHAL